ncbi:MAG: hypothetical protein IKR92_02865 [Alphaproteobacteria bacterium]|nr:hypothetical protein [Alphaproteobacteria bacterium]
MFYGYHIIQAADRLVPTDGYWQHIISAVFLKIGHIHGLILQEFGPNGFWVLLLFALFLALIVFIYAKSLIDTFKYGREEEENPEAVPDGLYYTIDAEPTASANDNTPEEPLYDEEEKERIEMERAISAELVRISQEAAVQTDASNLKQKMKQDALKEEARIKDVIAPKEPNIPQPAATNIPLGRVEDMVALILTLLSRGVSEAKTIQALYFYYKDLFKEEDVFQTVRSIRDFIGLCNAGKFDALPDIDALPTPAEALLNLAKGEATQCFVLMQALLNYQMQVAETSDGNIQSLNYAIAANYACLLGNIARLSDIELAHNSFELATEISPKNVKAWNRLGDMYILENSPEKAFIAFQNVLDIGDMIMYAPQIADAKQYLAAYFEKSGLSEKAEEMRTHSNRFYEIYGLHTPLTQAEQAVFQTLLNNSAENLVSSISVLLNRAR